jgi:hypothetical protein
MHLYHAVHNWPEAPLTHHYNRRATDRMPQPPASRDDILSALAEVQDPGQRVVLTILLRVVDEISAKIDHVLADEERIKMLVLGEYSSVHAVHHRHVEDSIPAIAKLNKAVAEIQEVHSAENGHCQFASAHIERDKVQRLRWIKVADGVYEKAVIAVLALTLGLFAPHLLALLK